MSRDQYTFTNPAELYSDIEPEKQHMHMPGSVRRPTSVRRATAAPAD